MSKKLIFVGILVITSIFIGNKLYSNTNPYSPYYNDSAQQYYDGKIPSEDYVDSLVGHMNVQKPYYGKFSSPEYTMQGDCYYYNDNEGNNMKFQRNDFGGWDVYRK